MQGCRADVGWRAGLVIGMTSSRGRQGVASQNTVYAGSAHADGPMHPCRAWRGRAFDAASCSAAWFMPDLGKLWRCLR